METIELNGMKMHTVGELPKIGGDAHDFTLVGSDLSEISLSSLRGKCVVLNIFPSLDTDVCAASVRRFNVEAARLPDTVVLCVSADLPFAAARFCTANGLEKVRTASTFRSDFGKAYGVEIADGPMRGLMARAVVVIDGNGKIVGTSVNPKITEEPDYDRVLSMLAHS